MSHPTELPCIQQFPIGQKFFRSLIAESATSQRVRGAPSESSHIQHRTRFSELVPAALLRRTKLLPAVPRAQSPFQFSLFLLWWVEDLPSVSRFHSVLVLVTKGERFTDLVLHCREQDPEGRMDLLPDDVAILSEPLV